MNTTIRYILGGSAVLFALLLAGSFAGALHPVGDSLAVFRLHFAAVLVLLALGWALAGRRAALALALVGACAVGPTAWMWVRPAEAVPAATLVHYQKNLLWVERDMTGLAGDIRRVAPDVLTVQELTEGNVAVLSALNDVLPAREVCRFERIGGVAVASAWAKIPGSGFCDETLGVTGMRVEAPQGPLWVVSLHLHWPYPYAQAEQMEGLLPILAGLDGPVVIGGDFNSVPWSTSVARIAEATGTARVGPARSTYREFEPLVPLPIDHVLAPEGRSGTTETRPRLGSDHLGLVARIAL